MDKIIIFGAGINGRSIYRKLHKENEIIAFIDNDDNKIGKTFKGLPIIKPKECNKLEYDYIAYTGHWHKEMREQLLCLGIDENKIKLIDKRELLYNNETREKKLEKIIKKLDEYMLSKNISYFIEGGAGLNVARGKSLALSHDVDISLLSYNDMFALENDLSIIFSDLNINIEKYKQDNIVRKQGDIYEIYLDDGDEYEPIMIDISFYSDYAGYKIMLESAQNKIHFLPKEIFLAGTVRKAYKDFYISMLAKYDEYFSLRYGKDYLQMPKSWSANDYGNVMKLDDFLLKIKNER